MPITIKELISSDSMSGVIEKINFNFDQLILAGGGPPGIQGIQGIEGPIGPQGFRGDHWFTGPTAFGQTADHDGTSLRIQDRFLDESGEVYEYYNIVGVTGWTASGINLKGPTGPEGAAGGSLEWKIYQGDRGNAVSDAASYGPRNDLAEEPNINLNFLIPNLTFKNSIFIGDQNWAYWNLRHLGTTNNNQYSSDAVPKFTVIQNNINTLGLNGFSFGGPLIENGPPGASSKYGDSGATSTGGPTYSAYNFVNAAFMTEQDIIGSDYITKWRLHSFRSNIKIKAGGNLSSGGYRPAMFEIEANRIRIYDYSKRKYMGLEPDVLFNYGINLNDTLKEIQINSPNDINRGQDSSLLPLQPNIYGYISLQNSEGAGNDVGSSFPEHRHGSVIIGPTYNTSQSIPLATDSYQGLAIVRKITRFDNTDSAIRFFQPNIQTGDANALLVNSRILSQSGTITPVRTTEEADNVNGITGVVLDSLVINASNSNASMSNIALSAGVTAFNGGRLGLSNNPKILTKPQFPIHLYAYPDFATRNFMWDGDAVRASDRISKWYAGFDLREENSNRNGGIAFGNTTWKDDYVPSSPQPSTLTNPVIKTYIRRDSDANGSVYGNPNFSLYESYYQVQGYENPHIYMQPGIETSTGNIGIGFVPGSTTYNQFGSINLGQISYAKSKLAVNGSITIGSTHSGYHKYSNNVPSNGLLVGGLIVQGETVTQGLNTIKLKLIPSNVQNFSYTPDNPIARIQVGFATEKTIMAKQFLSKGSPSSMYPDFALPDAKTGMGRMPGESGVGALFADRLDPYATNNVTSSVISPTMVAKWSARGDGPNSRFDQTRLGATGVGGFTVTEAFALSPKYYNINTIPWYAVNVIPSTGGGNGSHRIIYYEIPAKNSTIFLDLRDIKTNFAFFPAVSNADISFQTTSRYLNGDDVNGNGTGVGVLPNSFQFTIEDGYYEGQILRIMVLDVHPKNYSTLVPNAISRYTNYFVNPTVVSSPSVIKKDNIVMAAEKWSGTSSSPNYSGWPLSFPGNNETSAFNDQRPWPMPGNAKKEPLNITPSTSVVSASAIDTAIRGAFDQYNRSQNQWWSDILRGSYVETYSAQSDNGSHGVVSNSLGQLGDTDGIGAFRITPWRTITLQWKRDGQYTQSYGRGCWYEIARENLVSRKTRVYSGSGSISNINQSNPNGVNTAIIPIYTMDDANSPTYRFAYSFYNPTGLGSLIFSWDGSGNISLNQTESGFFENSASLVGCRITVPEQSGINYIEVRYKVTAIDTRTNISKMLADEVRTSIGPAISYTAETQYNTSPNQTLSIEASVIIRKDTTTL
jgi:hypothetical protein